MSIIDRILGRTPIEGPQIHAPGKPAVASPGPAAELPGVAANAPAAAPAVERVPASEGMIRVYDQFGRAVTLGPGSLATRCPAAESAGPAEQPR
jgi:hypothetical protein